MTALPGTEQAAAIVAALTRRGHTLATCESLTGGLVAAALTTVPGSSAVFRGGLVTYDPELKITLAGVDPATVEDGVVTEQTAVEMAVGARARCGADYAVATTGVAGPGPADGVRAGTVWLALVWAGTGTELSIVTRRLQLAGERDAVRAGTVEALFAELLAVLDVR